MLGKHLKFKIDEFKKSNLNNWIPTKENVKRAHNILMEYVKDDKNPLIIRKFKDHPQRGKFYDEHNFWCSDNEAAIWFYCLCVQGLPDSFSFEDSILKQEIPIGFARNSKKNENKDEWNNWGRCKEAKEFSRNGFKDCHILQAAPKIEGELDRKEAVKRFIRYFHPLNHFPWPKPKGYGAGGWLPDHTEDQKLIGLFKNLYSEEYPEIYKEFLSIAIDEPSTDHFSLNDELSLSYDHSDNSSGIENADPGNYYFRAISTTHFNMKDFGQFYCGDDGKSPCDFWIQHEGEEIDLLLKDVTTSEYFSRFKTDGSDYQNNSYQDSSVFKIVDGCLKLKKAGHVNLFKKLIQEKRIVNNSKLDISIYYDEKDKIRIKGRDE